MSPLLVLHASFPCNPNKFQWASNPSRRISTFPVKLCLGNRQRRFQCLACLVSGEGVGSSNLNFELSQYRGSNVAKFQEYSGLNVVGSQMGMIPPMFSAPSNRITSGWLVLFFLIGVVFDKIWSSSTSDSPRNAVQRVAVPQVPASLSFFIEKDFHRKESVEWVNMIIGKLWKVYRSVIEERIVGLFQPVIDDLEKPGYVQRVEVKEFTLGNEPLSVRTVDRRTSRSMDDLQYHVGIRYAGGASMLLLLSLKFGSISISVPVGLQDVDIDGELWVKLRLLPLEPWIEPVSWAFVSHPTIKFKLSPFRLVNLMAIPVFSMFLNKLFTEDLPRQFVLPRKVLLDLAEGGVMNSNIYHSNMGMIQAAESYSGELSVTLVDARKLSSAFFWADPFVVLSLGDELVQSKKNSQTTVNAPPDKPIWNQDFHMLVNDPEKQKLFIHVKGSIGFAELTIGVGEVGVWTLQDTVPKDVIVQLRRVRGLFKRTCGEVLLRLTYKAYVEEDDTAVSDTISVGIVKQVSSVPIVDITPIQKQRSFAGSLQASIESKQCEGIIRYEDDYGKFSAPVERISKDPLAEPFSVPFHWFVSGGSFWFWLAIVTGGLALVSIGMSVIFGP